MDTLTLKSDNEFVFDIFYLIFFFDISIKLQMPFMWCKNLINFVCFVFMLTILICPHIHLFFIIILQENTFLFQIKSRYRFE